MLRFDSDYMEGAHPSILQRLTEINFNQNPGYGTDAYCDSAKAKIKAACAAPNAEVHFLVGGTQTNATVIGACLRSYEGVLCAETGHIACHEAGAVEVTGRKALTLPHYLGKVAAEDVKQYMETFYGDANHDHMVFPGMLYISHPTEFGTLYTKAELESLHELCAAYHIPLYLDGARMGYGLAAKGTDVTLPVIAQNCDLFYIGGTKVGALFGEALVVTNPALLHHFFTVIKQRGALMAKGWLLGLQFDTLFTDGLYEKIAAHAIELAEKLRNGFAAKGCNFYIDSPTNQQFLIVEDTKLETLRQAGISFSFWEKYDAAHTVVRFCTSWATEEASIDTLLALL